MLGGGSVERFVMDFTTSRLPPIPAPRHLNAGEIEQQIVAESAVRSCDPGLVCVVDTAACDVGEVSVLTDRRPLHFF